MALDTGLFDFGQGVTSQDSRVTLNTFHLFCHHIGLRAFLTEGFSPDELNLMFMTADTFRCCLKMTTQTFDSRLKDLSMLFSSGMTGVAIQYPCDMFSVGERKVKNLDLCLFKPLMAFVAL
jgi:hypothetical protein